MTIGFTPYPPEPIEDAHDIEIITVTDGPTDDPVTADAIPSRVRSWLYLAALIVGTVGTATVSIVGALGGDAVVVAAIVGALTTLLSTLTGGLGKIYLTHKEQ